MVMLSDLGILSPLCSDGIVVVFSGSVVVTAYDFDPTARVRILRGANIL